MEIYINKLMCEKKEIIMILKKPNKTDGKTLHALAHALKLLKFFFLSAPLDYKVDIKPFCC